MSPAPDLSEFALEETVRLIINASVSLKCSVVARSKALLIYHHFQRCVHEKKYESHLVAAACLSLSIKFHEEGIKFDAIMIVILCIKNGVCHSTQDENFKTVKNSVMLMECVILRMLEFALNHALAHEYLVYFLNDMREELSNMNIWNVITETSMRIASDFYFTNRCLNYKAEEIASSVIQAALYLAGINATEEVSHLNAWLKNINDCSETRRLDIMEDIFKICDVGPAAESGFINF